MNLGKREGYPGWSTTSCLYSIVGPGPTPGVSLGLAPDHGNRSGSVGADPRFALIFWRSDWKMGKEISPLSLGLLVTEVNQTNPTLYTSKFDSSDLSWSFHESSASCSEFM